MGKEENREEKGGAGRKGKERPGGKGKKREERKDET